MQIYRVLEGGQCSKAVLNLQPKTRALIAYEKSDAAYKKRQT